MKTRSGFVSNSSSTSFYVVAIPENFELPGIEYFPDDTEEMKYGCTKEQNRYYCERVLNILKTKGVAYSETDTDDDIDINGYWPLIGILEEKGYIIETISVDIPDETSSTTNILSVNNRPLLMNILEEEKA